MPGSGAPEPDRRNHGEVAGGEFFADVRADLVLLSAITGDGPSGFEQVRPGAWVSTVPASECEIFERVFTAEVDGVPVRLLRRSASQARVLLLSDDPAEAEGIGATLVEPGVYEAIVETSRLANTQGVENQLTGAAE